MINMYLWGVTKSTSGFWYNLNLAKDEPYVPGRAKLKQVWDFSSKFAIPRQMLKNGFS